MLASSHNSRSLGASQGDSGLDRARARMEARKGTQEMTQKPKKKCPNPACDELKIIELNGEQICESCGTQVSSANIVSEIQFGESSAGAAVVQGAYVREGQRHAKSMGISGRRLGYGLDDDLTLGQALERGSEAVDRIANALQGISAQDREAAKLLYKIANETTRFTQGRSVDGVAGACLVAASRHRSDEHLPLALSDVAEKLHIDIYTLGRYMKDLISVTGVLEGSNRRQAEPVEYADLLNRYARRLEFENKTDKVASDAFQIFKRMSKDWITQGRHPGGLCGACLILAARMNNFRRTVREVVYIVKVTPVTLGTRLAEFKRTAASTIPIAEFRQGTDHIPGESLPPVTYKRIEKAEKERRAAEEAAAETASNASNETESSASSGTSAAASNESGTAAEGEQEEEDEERPRKKRKGKGKAVAAQQMEQAEAQSQPKKRGKRTAAAAQSEEQGAEESRPTKKRKSASAATTVEGQGTQPAKKPTRKRKNDASAAATAKEQPKAKKARTAQTSTAQRRDADGFVIPDVPVDPILLAVNAVASSSSAPADADNVEVRLGDELLDQYAAAEDADDSSDEDTSEDGTSAPARRKRGRPKKDRSTAPPPTEEDIEEENQFEQEIEKYLDDAELWAQAQKVQLILDEDDLAATYEEQQARIKEHYGLPEGSSTVSAEEIVDENEFADDPEVQFCRLSDAEAAIKERIWSTENADWIRDQHHRALQKELLEAAGGPKRTNRKRKRRALNENEDGTPMQFDSASEAVRTLLEKRVPGFSKRLNYEAINKVYSKPGQSDDTSSKASGSGRSSRRESTAESSASPSPSPAPSSRAHTPLLTEEEKALPSAQRASLIAKRFRERTASFAPRTPAAPVYGYGRGRGRQSSRQPSREPTRPPVQTMRSAGRAAEVPGATAGQLVTIEDNGERSPTPNESEFLRPSAAPTAEEEEVEEEEDDFGEEEVEETYDDEDAYGGGYGSDASQEV